jgi:hypothetical protein
MNSETIDAAGLNEDQSMNTEQGIKMVGESLRFLSFVRGWKDYRRIVVHWKNGWEIK